MVGCTYALVDAIPNAVGNGVVGTVNFVNFYHPVLIYSVCGRRA